MEEEKDDRTVQLGKIAQEYSVYIMAQAKARHEYWPDLFFNVGLIIDPDGNVIFKHHNLKGNSNAS